ncbi:unnamed protein product [Coffea canephora]|uniref:DH200=94 genomic scaffold, scaffold_1200 n=1 Tax=Coffea canephora TaxID=49390 RepID=A0A068VIJ3_COFCA|nr:uncharacterized protein LOC113691761 [Coffea arabica]XP_027175864.1 uncharacterized protein LOC113775263 [Coffea eugenioides]CDP20432.1 unnamed protein product [Coffea canephora]
MQRPTVVIVLLMMIVLTSRIELKPRTLVQPEVAAGAAATATHLHGFSDPQQSLKEKIILSQEQSIQKLNELVQTLKQQLEFCRAVSRNAVNDTGTSVSQHLNEIEHP